MWVGHGARIIVNELPCRGVYGSGILTASGGGDLNIHIQYGALVNYDFHIDSIIGDFTYVGLPYSKTVSLRVYGAHNSNSVVVLGGGFSNTYTGYTTVDGRGNEIALAKTGGAIAIQRDVIVSNQAGLNFHESNQLGSGTVTIRNHSWLGHFSSDSNKDISNRIRKLVVDGFGTLGFGSEYRESGKRWVYFDDIEIINDGWLEVVSWEYGRDFFLISKAIENAGDILSRISFNGYDKNKMHLEDFNTEYWAVVAPEPATYGAILGAAGLGLFVYCKRQSVQRARWRTTGDSPRAF